MTLTKGMQDGWWVHSGPKSHRLKPQAGKGGFVRSICGVVFAHQSTVTKSGEPGSDNYYRRCARCEELQHSYGVPRE